MANYKTSQVTAYSFSVFACLQLAEVKCGHLLTGSIGSGYTAWLVMHSFFTNRRSIKKSLRMIKTPSAIQFGHSPPPSAVCVHNFQRLHDSKRSCSSYSYQVPSRPSLLVLACTAKMLLNVCMRRMGALTTVQTDIREVNYPN